jgi:uncharacterized protein YhjY with autotransporter beta-barrel domain
MPHEGFREEGMSGMSMIKMTPQSVSGRSVYVFALCVVLLMPVVGRAQAPSSNQKSMQAYLSSVCANLAGPATGALELSGPQEDLFAQCALLTQTSPTSLKALNPILGQQINALGPETKKFGSLQQDNITARLSEVRHGVTGVSLAGLTFTDSDGNVIANGASQIDDFLPVGASGDGNGPLLDGKLGVFLNGSLQEGAKEAIKVATVANSFVFDVKNDTVTLGADYRVTDQFVVGAAFGTGRTITDFANSLGRLDLTARGVSLYASLYGDTYYVDALMGYGVPKLDTDRHIAYAFDGSTPVDQEAYGSTHLHDLWTGLSAGRPFNWGAIGLTPEASLNFHEIRISQFGETMSDPTGPGSGLGLNYGATVVPSLQGRAGVRGSYTWTGSWGVFIPNAHATYVREFRDHSDEFSAQFINAPAADASLAEVLKTAVPESHYMAYGAGLSFQLAHSVSGFVEYEELKTLQTIKSHEFTLGVRYQVGL